MTNLTFDTLIINLAGEIDRLTNHFVFDGYTALASLLKAPFGAMLVLYIVLMGYAMVRGVVQAPQQELFKFTIRAGTIYMTAMNWEFFAANIRDLFVIGSDSIATTLMQAVHQKVNGGSINQGLQAVLNEILTLGSNLFEAGSFRKLTPYFAGIMVFFSGCITVGLAFIEIVSAKLMLAITLCTAPLFIIFTLFEQTKAFFERWLGILVGFALVLVFVSSVVGLCVHLLHWIMAGVLNNSMQLTSAIWVPLFIVSILCVMGITQAASIGKSIGGAMCTSGGASLVGGFIGSSISSLTFSKNTIQKSLQVAQASGKQSFANSRAIFQKMQQNLRRGKG